VGLICSIQPGSLGLLRAGGGEALGVALNPGSMFRGWLKTIALTISKTSTKNRQGFNT
jgi:hypothetical protein